MLWVPGDLAHKKKNSRVDPHPADRQGSPLNRKFTVRYRDSPNRNPTEHRTCDHRNFKLFELSFERIGAAGNSLARIPLLPSKAKEGVWSHLADLITLSFPPQTLTASRSDPFPPSGFLSFTKSE